MRKFVFVLLTFFVVIFLCSCTKVIENPSDELTSYSYKSEFENGNVVSLSFFGDNATLKMNTKRGECATISGFCEVSATQFVIFDTKTGIGYPFGYAVYFDRVDIMHEGNVLTLYKL